MTFPITITADQENKETPITEMFDTVSYSSVYGERHAATSGLTWGYHGGRWGGFSVADGTLSLTASNSNYVVVLRSTGAISTSTSITNWNDTTTYARVFLFTTNGSGITATDDYRAGPDGVHGAGGGSSAVSSVNGQTGAVVIDSFDIEHTDSESLFGSPSTVGNALRDIAVGQYEWSGMIEEPEDKTYTLVLKAAFPGSILETTTDAASGTGTATWSINGTPLGGTANTVSSTEQSQLHSSANTFVAGDTIAFAIVNDSPSILDFAFSVRYRRTWA